MRLGAASVSISSNISGAFAPARSLAAVSVLAISLAGCATAIPLPSFVARDDATATVRAPVSPLAPGLDTEDWRRAQGALSLALDPQGNGEAVDWSNPASGAKGSFIPVGEPYPSDDKICRVFLADLVLGDPGRKLQGVSCRPNGGDWTIIDVKPWKKG